MEALEQLKSVLCDPEGNVCISGSDGDRKVISDALESLDQQVAALTEYNKTRTDELIAAGKQVAALTKEHEFACEIGADYRDKWMAAQEREAKLLEALVDYDNQASEYDGRTSKELGDRIKSLLALPIDDSALMERLKEEYKRGYKAGITTGSMT